MLFNSYGFLFGFLPPVLLGYFSIGRHHQPLAALWLFLSSIFFYSWWNPAFVGLLLTSIIFNFSIGVVLAREQVRASAGQSNLVLGIGVGVDLLLLAYFKYANFFISTSNDLLNLGWRPEAIILPLGISFFTFTQIAYLVDARRGEVKEANFVHYGLFVTYFPHLIAGPVLHHKEMMPQFALPASYRVWENASVGLTIFTIGLFKKVVLADGIAPFANSVFSVAAHGGAPTLLEAWCGVLAYTFQLYFDFSGYSDMAIGLSRLFGIKLPLNFNSPYKAVNISDFWRRWHMTLSRFLRDYLYVPLGGNRKGPIRRYVNLMITMLLGGLWHGAGWTFVIWGGLHGLFLVVNHGWQRVRIVLGHDLDHESRLGRISSMTLTFLAVVIGWVFFRAESFHAALALLGGMVGQHGVVLPGSWYDSLHWRIVNLATGAGIRFGPLPAIPGNFGHMLAWIGALWAVVWMAPNTQEIMANFKPSLEKVAPARRFLWRPSTPWLLAAIALLAYGISEIGGVSEFLYFQF